MEKKLGERTYRLSNRTVFICGSIAALTVLVLRSFLTRGAAFENLLHCFPMQTFMDHFESLMVVRKGDPYEAWSIYPPFAYLIYSLFNHFLPENILRDNGIYAASKFEVRTSQMGLMSTFIYLMLCIIFFWIIVKLLQNPKRGDAGSTTNLIFICLLFSFPVLYTIERGNLILLTMMLSAVFAGGYNSSNKLVRYFSLLCLAMAAACKIYPALFGVILIKEKRWKDAAICIIFGLLCFFLPFFAFGGMATVDRFSANLAHTTNKAVSLGYGYKVNVTNFINTINALLDTGINGKIVLWIEIGILTFVFLVSKSKWISWACMTLAVVLIPSVSYTYTLIFLIIPLLIFLSEEDRSGIGIVFSLLFVVIFAAYPFGQQNFFAKIEPMHFLLTLTSFMENVGLQVFLLVMFINEIYLLFRRRNKRAV